MIFLNIKQTKLVIGINWFELILSDNSKSKSKLEKDYLKRLSSGNDFGVKNYANNGQVISVGEFKSKVAIKKELLFPNIYSLASIIAHDLVNGIYVMKVNVSMLDAETSTSFTGVSSDIVKRIGAKEDYYWACSFQDGVVISGGEVIGNQIDVARFIDKQTMFSTNLELFGESIEFIESNSGLKTITKDIEDLLKNPQKISKISRIRGINKRISLGLFLLVSFFIIINAFYDKSQKEKAMEIMKSANQSIQKNIPMTNKIEQEKEEQIRLEKERINEERKFFNVFERDFKTDFSGIDFNFTQKVSRTFVNATPSDWSLNSIICKEEKCTVILVANSPSSLIKNITSFYKIKLSDIEFDDKGEEVIIIFENNNQSSIPKINKSVVKGYFDKLEDEKEQANIIINLSKINKLIFNDFSWNLSPSRKLEIEYRPFEFLPESINDRSLVLIGNNYYEMPSIYNRYDSLGFLHLNQFEIKASKTEIGMNYKWAIKLNYATK